MHNFDENKCWKPMVRKYRACVSLSGNVVDVLDIHDQIVASFTISIKFGKVALEEMISHSLIVIPVDGNAESFSPFTYDFDTNTIKVTIMKTDGKSQVFSASLDDLMKLTEMGYIGDDAELKKPNCPCDKNEEKNEEELDPDFSYTPEESSCDCGIKFEPEHCHKPHKPLVDPYVTRSELMEESKKRQYNDLQIRDMIGENKDDKKSIFYHIDSLTSGLNHEVERSRHEDRIHKEKIAKLEYELESLHKLSQNNDCELRKMIAKETDTRSDAYSELLRLINMIQAEDCSLLGKFEKLNKDHARDTQVLRTSDRELHGEIMAEQAERVTTDKELRNLIRIEETNRFQAVKEALSKIDIEYHRATIAEEEIKQDMGNYIETIIKNEELLKESVKNVALEAEKKYQPKGEYVILNSKGVLLESDRGLYIESVDPLKSKTPLSIAKLNIADNIEIGDSKTGLELTGEGETFVYNGNNVALVKDIPSLTNYVQQESLNEALEQIASLQKQLETLTNKYNALENNYDTLRERVYQLEIK